MRGWVGVLIVALTAVALPAADTQPPAGWKEVKGGYKNQAYVVWLPADGKTDSSKDSIVSPKFGQILIYRTVWQRKGGPLFAAGQILLPPQLTTASAKVRQDFFRDMFLEEVNGKLVEEKKASLGTMAGKEYLAQTPKGMARYRLLGTGVQVFRLVAVGTKEQLQSKDVDTFFNSFKRTPAVEKK